MINLNMLVSKVKLAHFNKCLKFRDLKQQLNYQRYFIID